MKKELEAQRGQLDLDDAQLATISQAGFSNEFIEFLKSLAPAKTLDNAAIQQMLLDGATPLAVLGEMADATGNYDASAQGLLALSQQVAVPASVVWAMKGKPLRTTDVEALIGRGSTPDEIEALIEVVGVAREPVGAQDALALSRAGLSPDQVQQFRTLAAAPVETPPEETQPVGSAAEELAKFRHVIGLFEMSYPKDWYFKRRLVNGDVVYYASPDRDIDDVRAIKTGTVVSMLSLRDQNISDAETLLAHLSAQIQQASTDFELIGEASSSETDGQKSVSQAFKAKVDGDAVRGKLIAMVEGDFGYLMSYNAPEAEFDALQPTFEVVFSNFKPTRLGQESYQAQTRQDLTERYAESIVNVVSWDDDKSKAASGTGFFVRGDGYLLTNAHVILNLDKKRPYKNFEIVWPDRFDREPERAELKGWHLDSPEFVGFSVGEDIALLKTSPTKPVLPIPLTPLADVSLGDEVVVVGYPIQDFFDSRASTTVTSGVVTRFVRDDKKQIETIISDARVAGGNSGGPAISLRTGGVVGLATIASSKILKQLTEADLADAAGYAGIFPSSRAMHFFPEETMTSSERALEMDYLDAYDLALRSEQMGFLDGALTTADKAINRRPQIADGHSLSGQIHMRLGNNEKRRKEAIRAFDRALSINPEHIPTLIARTNLELAMKEYISALRYANRAVEAGKTGWINYYTRAQVNMALGRYDEALADLNEAQRLSGELVPHPFALAGAVQYRKKKYDEGRALFQKAVDLAPTNVQARIGLGDYHLNKGNYYSALIEYDRLNTDAPDNHLVLAAIGLAYGLLNEYPKSLNNYSKALEAFLDQSAGEPAPLYLYEATAVAAKNARNVRLASLAYSNILEHYPIDNPLLNIAAREYLADQAEEDHPAVAHGNLKLALKAAKNESSTVKDRVRKRLKENTKTKLTMANIDYLSKFYTRATAIELIKSNDLTFDFKLKGTMKVIGENRYEVDKDRADAFKILNKEFGPKIADAVFWKAAALERQGQQQGQQQQGGQGGQGQQTGECDPNNPPATVQGTWVYKGRTASVELMLGDRPDWKFSTVVIKDGQRSPYDNGTWDFAQGQHNGQEVQMLVLKGQRPESRTPISLARDPNDPCNYWLILVQNNVKREYKKVAAN
ncbi:MAG: trypsin-like peptidase domain-containing protein [Pseudomonadota bacterium]